MPTTSDARTGTRRHPLAPGLMIAAAVASVVAGFAVRAQPAENGGGGVIVVPGADLPADAKESLQNVTVNDSPEARKDIETARTMERQKEWIKAAGWYQEVLEKYRTRVVAWKANDRNVIDRYRGIVYEVQQSLAKWPAEGITAYRSRYEGTAQQLLDGAAADDLNALNTVLETYFVTEAAKVAGLRLIDLHMEAGEFDAAARVGDLLLDSYPGDHLVVERPRLLFRTALAHHLCGDDAPAKARAEELKQKFATATGTIFGKDAILTEKLDDLLKVAPVVAQAGSPDGWTMFGGAPDRARVSSAKGRTGAKIYSIPLPHQNRPATPVNVRGPTGGGGPADVAAAQAQADDDRGMSLGVMPVVEGGELYFQDGVHVWARSLDSGIALPGWAQTYGGDQDGVYQLKNAYPQRGGQFTLTLTDASVLGVMGQSSRGGNGAYGQAFGERNANADSGTRLVCLDRQSGVERWKVSLAALPADGLRDDERERLRALDLTGSPLVVGDNVFVLGRGGQDAQFENCYALCFDLNTGKYRWSCLVASANTPFNAYLGGQQDGALAAATVSHLAYAGGRVYAVTNLGALAAIDAYNGSVVWLTLYRRDAANQFDPRMGAFMARRNTLSNVRPWEYNPVIAHDGKLFVMPVDSKYLLVYEEATGKELKAIDLTDFRPEDTRLGEESAERPHALIGVIGDSVILTSATRVYAVKWDAYDVSGNRSFLDNIPENVVDSTPVGTFHPSDAVRGRAFLTNDAVFVASDRVLTRLDVRKKLKLAEEYPQGRGEWDETEGPGNVVVTGEHVVIAGAQGVNVYTDMSLARAKLDREVAAAPDDPAARLHYGEVMFAAGQTGVALEKLNDAARLLGGVESMRVGAQRQRVFNLSLNFANRLARVKQGEANEAAVKFFDLAAAAANLPDEQVNYRLKRAQFTAANVDLADGRNFVDAVELYQQILNHDEWRRAGVPVGDGATGDAGASAPNNTTVQQAGTIAEREIRSIKARHPEAYAAQEAKAVAAVAEAKKAEDPAKLLEVATAYPNADVAPRAMLEAATAYEHAGNARLATHVLIQVYRQYGNTQDKGAILEAMVRNYLALPGGLDVAVARLQRARNFADTKLTQPLKLPDGSAVAAGTSFKDALAAMAKVRTDVAAAAPLPDLHVPKPHGGEGAPPAAFVAATDARAVTVKDVTQLVSPPADLRDAVRADRVVAVVNNQLALLKPGDAQPLGSTDALSEPPRWAVWVNGPSAGAGEKEENKQGGDAKDRPPQSPSTLVAWSGGEIVALSGADAKLLWKCAIKDLVPSELVNASGLQGAEVINQGSQPNANGDENGDVVVMRGGRFVPRRVLVRNNFGRFNGQLPAAPAAEEAPAPGAPEQVSQVQPLGDRLIVGTTTGRVACLGAADGKVLWQTRLSAHNVERLVASEDFTVARVTEDNKAYLVALDNYNGQMIPKALAFPDANSMPQNMAISPDGLLVWTTPDRLCARDLYESSDQNKFEFPPANNGRPDGNAAAANQPFNGQAFNANAGYPQVFAGANKPGQLLIRGRSILTLENGGRFVVAHSLEDGSVLTHVDSSGRPTPTRLSTNAPAGSTQAPNAADVQVTMRLAGPYLYAMGPRSMIAYNLDRPIDDHWVPEWQGLSANPNFKNVIPTKDELVLVAEPGTKRPAPGAAAPVAPAPADVNLGAPVAQLRLYSREQAAAPGVEGTAESGYNDYIVNLADPSGVKDVQVVDGGVYYLTGDHALHFLPGTRE